MLLTNLEQASSSMTIKAKYYTDELFYWAANIIFYKREINYLQLELTKAIRNTHPDTVAVKATKHITQLDSIYKNFCLVEPELREQVLLLISGNTFVKNTTVREQIEKEQKMLRQKIKHSEKEYICLSNDCYNILYECRPLAIA